MEIRDCRSAEQGAVVALLKTAKATVGFLPDQAIADRIAVGTLLVAVDDTGEIAGYLLYDLPRSVVTIRQLVVDGKRRGEGIARALVEELVVRYGESRRGIGLTCRRDFQASRAWERLDFTPLSERPGRGKVPASLTFWWRSFNQPDLFTLIHEADERPLVVIDTNLVIRAGQQDPSVVDRLFADWVTESVRIAIAPHSLVELHRNEDQALRERTVKFALGFDTVDFERTTARALETAIKVELGQSLAGRHPDDIRLTAQAAAAGARWFVTDDGKFQRPCGSAIRAAAGIELLSLSDMVLAADRLLRGDRYSAADLLGTDITIRTVDPGESDQLARTFLDQRTGESLKVWRKVLAQHLADVESSDAFVFCEGSAPLALVVIRRGAVLEAPVCRVARVNAEPTVARHLLGWLRDRCLEVDGAAIKITEPALGPWLDKALGDEGYLPQASPVAVPMTGRGPIADVVTNLRSQPLCEHVDASHADELASVPPTPRAALSVEAVFHPFMLTGAGLRTVRVPITPTYALQLFDHSLSAGQLFARERSIALAREHVYFRSPNVRALLEPPARILWQVTGKPMHGGGTIRGWSLLNDCVVGDVGRLIARFAQFGVLDEDEIRSYSKNGQVMALRFSHTQVFTHPVTLAQYRDAMDELEPGKGLSSAGPQPVTEAMFARLRDLGA